MVRSRGKGDSIPAEPLECREVIENGCANLFDSNYGYTVQIYKNARSIKSSMAVDMEINRERALFGRYFEIPPIVNVRWSNFFGRFCGLGSDFKRFFEVSNLLCFFAQFLWPVYNQGVFYMCRVSETSRDEFSRNASAFYLADRYHFFGLIRSCPPNPEEPHSSEPGRMEELLHQNSHEM
jgi:hypothetical protein